MTKDSQKTLLLHSLRKIPESATDKEQCPHIWLINICITNTVKTLHRLCITKCRPTRNESVMYICYVFCFVIISFIQFRRKESSKECMVQGKKVTGLCQFSHWTFCPQDILPPWTYSMFPAYKVKTEASSFGCF